MPCPRPDGSLTRGSAPWTTVDAGTLPLIHLGCPMNRADRLVKEAWGGVLNDAVKKILGEFLVTGAFVVVAPEVTCLPALSRDPNLSTKFRGLDGEARNGVRLMCPHCRANDHTMAEKSWNTQVRAVHTAKGRNLFVLARRYRCFNPQCSKVREIVKKKMAGSHGNDKIYVREGAGKREITPVERALMRDGQLGCFPPDAIRVFFKGGWSFEIDDARYMALLPPTARLKD